MNKTLRTGLIAVFALALVFSVQAVAEESQGNSETAKQANPATSDTVKKDGTEKTPAVNRVQKREAKRIKEGVKSGELTKEEAKELRQDQRKIQEQKKEAKADGKVTKEERKGIRKEQKKESKKIYKMKHNEDKRPAK